MDNIQHKQLSLASLLHDLKSCVFFLNCYGISAINSTEIAWKTRIPPNNIGEWFLSLETSPIWWYKDMLFFWFSFKTLNDLWIFTYFWYGTVDLFEKSGAVPLKQQVPRTYRTFQISSRKNGCIFWIGNRILTLFNLKVRILWHLHGNRSISRNIPQAKLS